MIEDFADREFVTEAVFEDLQVKATVLDTLSRVCPRDCLIATNTSTIPISTLASKLPPERRPGTSTRHASWGWVILLARSN